MIAARIEDEGLCDIVRPNRLIPELRKRLEKYEKEQCDSGLHDEQIWTFLFVYGFATPRVAEQHGRAALANALTQGAVKCEGPPKVSLEMLPMPARQGKDGKSESNTEIDLIIGDHDIRRPTQTGVEFKPDGKRSWICMVEAKWLSDIACRTTHDLHRNQLARVIETALVFQGHGEDAEFPDEVHVTLLTPARFQHAEANRGSRLYYYKFQEYFENRETVLGDIENASIRQRKDTKNWRYPNLKDRLPALRLHWVTYEDLFRKMPESDFRRRLESFIKKEAGGVLML